MLFLTATHFKLKTILAWIYTVLCMRHTPAPNGVEPNPLLIMKYITTRPQNFWPTPITFGKCIWPVFLKYWYWDVFVILRDCWNCRPSVCTSVPFFTYLPSLQPSVNPLTEQWWCFSARCLLTYEFVSQIVAPSREGGWNTYIILCIRWDPLSWICSNCWAETQKTLLGSVRHVVKSLYTEYIIFE